MSLPWPQDGRHPRREPRAQRPAPFPTGMGGCGGAPELLRTTLMLFFCCDLNKSVVQNLLLALESGQVLLEQQQALGVRLLRGQGRSVLTHCPLTRPDRKSVV